MSEQMLVPRAPRLLPLTGIRFVAAVAVFNSHAVPPVGAPLELQAISLSGHNGMTLFFILSGFILAWNYDDLLSRRLTVRGLRTFFVARFARIYPLYLLALALVIVPTIGSAGQISTLAQSREFWLHLFALQTWSGNQAIAFGYNGPGWSIGVEFFLYALLPLLLLAIGRVRNSLRGILAIALGAVVVLFAITLAFQLSHFVTLPLDDPMSPHRWLYRTPLTRIPDFVLGIALCYLVKFTASWRLERWGRLAQIAGVILALALMVIPPVAYSIWSYDAANMIPVSLVLVGLLWSPETVLARTLGSRIGVFLGEASFAFYLLHQTVINFVGRAGGGYAGWISSWITAFVITIFAAAGAHILFERPMRAWLRRRLDPRPLISPTPVGAQEVPVPES